MRTSQADGNKRRISPHRADFDDIQIHTKFVFLDCTRYCFHSINVCMDTVHKHSVHTYTCTHTQRHTTNTHTTCLSIQTTVDEAHAFFWKKRGVCLKMTTEAQHVTFGTHSQESVLITTSRNPHPLTTHTRTTETTSLGREMLHVTNYSCTYN